jgi:hypothetical protein
LDRGKNGRSDLIEFLLKGVNAPRELSGLHPSIDFISIWIECLTRLSDFLESLARLALAFGNFFRFLDCFGRFGDRLSDCGFRFLGNLKGFGGGVGDLFQKGLDLGAICGKGGGLTALEIRDAILHSSAAGEGTLVRGFQGRKVFVDLD